jgi:hypothetical protein
VGRDEPREVVEIRISLQDIEPRVWRRVQVPADFPLRRLHDVIQAVMGWLDYHLHQFEIGDKLYGQPEIAGDDHFGPPLHSDRNTRLAQLLERSVERFTYIYDFGDDWRHDIEIERTIRAQPGIEYPILIAGERRGPPEDCGGPYGYLEFLDAISDPAHPGHEEAMDWYGEPFDPEDMELDTVEAMLSHIRGHRRKGPRKRKRA